jgi:exodeoxyribonuclease VII large subunit
MIKIEGARSKFGSLTTNLDALSPLKVLSRGYAIATRVKDGKIMKSPADVEDGERITLRLHEGILPCEARKKQ